MGYRNYSVTRQLVRSVFRATTVSFLLDRRFVASAPGPFRPVAHALEQRHEGVAVIALDLY